MAARHETERLFSSGATTSLLALFEDGLLQGRKVVIDPGPPAPVALTRVEVEPYRRRTAGLYSGKLATRELDPDPRVRITLGLYWAEIPFRVIEADRVEVDASLFADYPLDPAYTYRLVCAGASFTVVSSAPNEKGNKLRLRLSDKIGFPVHREATGSVHGGAVRVAVRVESVSSDKQGPSGPATHISDFEVSQQKQGSGSPVYQVEIAGVWPDDVVVHLVASNRSGRASLLAPVSTAVPRPPLPARESLERQTNTPKTATIGSSVGRADTRMSYVAQIAKTSGAAVVGILIRSSPTTTSDKAAAPEEAPRYVALPFDDVQWQLEPTGRPQNQSEKAPSGPTRTISLDLGPVTTSAETSFLVCTVDEMARTSARSVLTLAAAPPVYLPSPDLSETFGRVAELAIAPLGVDIESVAGRFVCVAEEMVRSAETRIESAVQGQPPVQQATSE